MSNTRQFTGSRPLGKKTVAREILQLEQEKGGKLPAAMRYKIIFQRRMEEQKNKAAQEYGSKFANQSGSLVNNRQQSKRAEQALKEMAMKKASKEAKKLKEMVIVQPRNYHNGSLTKKGQIYDIAGNIVGQVNLKNGKMSALNGWQIGKYKPKSYLTHITIQESINKYSPYFIKQRQMAMQQQALNNAHGQMLDAMAAQGAQAAMLGGIYNSLGSAENYGVYGPDDQGPRSNITMTAWGAMANNAQGVMSNNVHGTMADNVHGNMNADVWGSVGGDSLWGRKGVRMYGTGSGTNYLSGITKFILGLLGFKSKAARQMMRAQRAARVSGGGGGPRVSGTAGRR